VHRTTPLAFLFYGAVMPSYDVEAVRARFPALARTKNGKPIAYFDNPAGTQVSQLVVDRMVHAMLHANANIGGLFDVSVEAEEAALAAHAAAAEFLNAREIEEVFFGQNMTSLTFAMSRSIGRLLKAGDEIVLSRMDHDANISPWLMMAEERGVVVKWLDFSPESFEFDLDALRSIVGPRTRLVAVCYASNITGTINDVAAIARIAHEVGAWCYVDAVQFAAHGLIDVQAIDCDFLVCSGYKFYGPHYGLFYGKRALLEELTAYKVRPASDELPWKFVTGTTNREELAGIHGAIDYIKWVGERFGDGGANAGGRAVLEAGLAAMKRHDDMLAARLIDGISSVRGTRILGISDAAAMARRVSTVSFVMDGVASVDIERFMAGRGFQVWSGHNYAIELVGRLGLLESGGGVRVGPVHYNTAGEVDGFVAALAEMADRAG
jgi:cysteine desulfurase family protein (TIGR01976 family)